MERLADITTSFLPIAWAPEAITRTNATLFPPELKIVLAV